MTQEERKLLEKAYRMVELLVKHPQPTWTSYFRDVLYKLKNDQFHKGAKKILGAYGGMGSFNECDLTGAGEEEYQEFLNLKNSMYTLAKVVKSQNSWLGWLLQRKMSG